MEFDAWDFGPRNSYAVPLLKTYMVQYQGQRDRTELPSGLLETLHRRSSALRCTSLLDKSALESFGTAEYAQINTGLAVQTKVDEERTENVELARTGHGAVSCPALKFEVHGFLSRRPCIDPSDANQERTREPALPGKLHGVAEKILY